MYHHFINQSLRMYPGVNDSRDFWVQVALAIFTALAVFVALFQEWIKDWFNKAKLSPSIKLRPPDCHQIDLTYQQTGQYAGKSIYIRINVQHVKGKTAKNVEIILSKVQRENKNGRWSVVKKFLPMNLQWSHTHTQTVTIPPQSFRHCDLGSFRQINIVNQFLIDTIVQPNPVAGGELPNLLSPGKYKFDILLTGDNVIPVFKSWIIEFSPSWSKDQNEMLKKYIRIKEEK